MRWSSVVVFACVVVVGAATTGPVSDKCFHSVQCQYLLGPPCFCLKTQSEQLGRCICNMDLRVLEGCYTTEDCVNRGLYQYYCDRSKDTPGRCKYQAPLLG